MWVTDATASAFASSPRNTQKNNKHWERRDEEAYVNKGRKSLLKYKVIILLLLLLLPHSPVVGMNVNVGKACELRTITAAWWTLLLNSMQMLLLEVYSKNKIRVIVIWQLMSETMEFSSEEFINCSSSVTTTSIQSLSSRQQQQHFTTA